MHRGDPKLPDDGGKYPNMKGAVGALVSLTIWSYIFLLM